MKHIHAGTKYCARILVFYDKREKKHYMKVVSLGLKGVCIWKFWFSGKIAIDKDAIIEKKLATLK